MPRNCKARIPGWRGSNGREKTQKPQNKSTKKEEAKISSLFVLFAPFRGY
jgi:hypothetical protein